MKCPTCVANGASSTVYVAWQAMTLVHVPEAWDEQAKPIASNGMNHTTTHYACSRGHTWSEVA